MLRDVIVRVGPDQDLAQIDSFWLVWHVCGSDLGLAQRLSSTSHQTDGQGHHHCHPELPEFVHDVVAGSSSLQLMMLDGVRRLVSSSLSDLSLSLSLDHDWNEVKLNKRFKFRPSPHFRLALDIASE